MTEIAFYGEELARDIDTEVAMARQKFPDPRGLMMALTEEVGEVAKALADESPERIREECIQVAAMAIRLAEEGDPTQDWIREQRGQEVFRGIRE